MMSPIENEEITIQHYLKAKHRHITILYILLVLVNLSLIFLLPFVTLDVTVTVPGIIRPLTERTEVRSLQPGAIQAIYCSEGQLVRKGDLLIELKHPNIDTKLNHVINQMKQKKHFLDDLDLLLNKRDFKDLSTQFKTPVYRDQWFSFRHQLAEKQITKEKLDREMKTTTFLATERVISHKELEDKKNEFEMHNASYRSYILQRKGEWGKEKNLILTELQQLNAEKELLLEEKKLSLVHAPVTGVVQGINGQYSGEYIQAGEVFCMISPEDSLIAECLVPSRQGELVKLSNSVHFFIEAFNPGVFGFVKGKLLSIDNDFSVHNNHPYFKVRCSFDKNTLALKNGYKAKLKKGLALQARFLITRRTAAQLLFDRVEDWFNPQLLK